MMDAVMRRCYKEIFQPSHFVNELCMNENSPDLCGGINKYDVEWLEANPGQRNKINKPVKRLENRRPETNREIEIIGRVVGNMNGPEQATIMIHTMQPII